MSREVPVVPEQQKNQQQAADISISENVASSLEAEEEVRHGERNVEDDQEQSVKEEYQARDLERGGGEEEEEEEEGVAMMSTHPQSTRVAAVVAPRLPSGQLVDAKNTCQSHSTALLVDWMDGQTTSSIGALPSSPPQQLSYRHVTEKTGPNGGVGSRHNNNNNCVNDNERTSYDARVDASTSNTIVVAAVAAALDSTTTTTRANIVAPGTTLSVLTASAMTTTTDSNNIRVLTHASDQATHNGCTVGTAWEQDSSTPPPPESTPFATACVLPNMSTTNTTTRQSLPQSPPPQDLVVQHLVDPILVPVPEEYRNYNLERDVNGTSNHIVNISKANAQTRRKMMILLTIIVLIATSAVVLSAVCVGTDACSRRPGNNRAEFLTMYINDYVSLTNRSINIPSSNGTVHGEDWALSWLVDLDPLQLWPDADSPSSQFRFTQRYALLSLWYQQTVNEEWYNRSGWLVVEDECEWYGIRCQVMNAGNVVTHIELQGNNFHGTLSPELGLLDSLVHFNISNNSPRGELPTSMNRWSHLEYFDAGTNVETESLEIPFNELSISDMELTVSSWRKLRFFTWSSTSIAVSSVLSSRIGHYWPSMEHFDVTDGSITGILPDSMALWSNLTSLALTYAYFGGTIPEFVGEWTRLRNFDISGCYFTGTIPSAVGKWTNIEHVNMAENRLSGTLPESISSWTAIQSLHLGRKIEGRYYGDYGEVFNMFNGTLPESMGSWTNVRTVSLGNNKFTGSLPSFLGRWSRIRSFEASMNMFNGSLPAVIGNWVDIFHIDLSRNLLTGSLPPQIVGQWTHMSYFAIDNNRFSGSIPQVLAQWQGLFEAYMSANQLTGSVPNELCSLQRDNGLVLVVDCISEVKCQCCTECT